jgi:hypothetical protein
MDLLFTIAAGPRQRSNSQVLLSQIRDSSKPGGPGPRIYIPQEQGDPVIPPGTEFLFVTSYYLQGYGGGIGTRLHTGLSTRINARQDIYTKNINHLR